jgi:spermidine synthase
LLPGIGRQLAPLAEQLGDLPAWLHALRFVLAFSLLLVPSTAIGATLPLALRAISTDAPSFGRHLGVLYGLNTAGAVAGVLASELWVIEALGIRGGALVAASCSVLAAVLAFLVPAPDVSEAQAARRGASGVGTRLLVASFASGLLLLALEMVWLRLLMLFLNDTPLAFAVVLATVLVGIALGSVLGAGLQARWPSAPHYAPLLSYAAGLLGFAGYLSYPSFLQRYLTFDQAPFTVFLVCAPLVLPTALASGALYALLGASLRKVSGSDARAAGWLAFANTVGCALGAWLAGFLLLPALGMERSLFSLLLGYGAIGLLLAGARELSAVVRRGAIVAFLGAFAFFPFGFVHDRLVAGSARRWMTADDRVMAVREGLTATIVHIRHGFRGLAVFDQLATNAYSMSVNDFAARRYMKQYVVFPVAVHAGIRSALVIGYGVGNTAAALADQRELRRIDVVDVAPEILELSRRVEPKRARHPLDDPRVHVHIEDGRFFLQMTARRFDLITGEPPPPMMAGVGTLYSREYFELVRARLSEGGYATYWLPMMNLSASGAKAILAAFCAAFPDCSLWHGSARNFMLAGSNGAAGGVDAARFAAQFRDPALAPELSAIGFELPEQLGATFIGDAEYLRDLTQGVAPLTDDHPKRLLAPIDLEEREALIWQWRDTAAARQRFERSPLVAKLFPAELRQATIRQFENQRLLDDLLFPGQTAARKTVVFHQVLQGTRLRLPILLLLGSDPDLQRALAAAGPEARARPELRLHLAAGRLAERDMQGGLALLEGVPEREILIPDLAGYLRYAIARTSRTPSLPAVSPEE